MPCYLHFTFRNIVSLLCCFTSISFVHSYGCVWSRLLGLPSKSPHLLDHYHDFYYVIICIGYTLFVDINRYTLFIVSFIYFHYFSSYLSIIFEFASAQLCFRFCVHLMLFTVYHLQGVDIHVIVPTMFRQAFDYILSINMTCTIANFRVQHNDLMFKTFDHKYLSKFTGGVTVGDKKEMKSLTKLLSSHLLLILYQANGRKISV